MSSPFLNIACRSCFGCALATVLSTGTLRYKLCTTTGRRRSQACLPVYSKYSSGCSSNSKAHDVWMMPRTEDGPALSLEIRTSLPSRLTNQLMGKDNKSLGLNKAALAGGGKKKSTGSIPLKGKSQLGVNKPATAGGRNRKRLGGAGLGGAKRAGGEGGRGRGGASTFCPTDRSTTSKMVVNEEEENRRSAKDGPSTLSPTDESTFTKTAGKATNDRYRDAEEGGQIQNAQEDEARLLFAHYGYVPGCCFDDGYDYSGGGDAADFWW